MRQLYLAATGQNRGKTTAALGLLNLFVREGLRTGFMKPVGQRTIIEQGVPADEDAVLMRAVFGLPERLDVMSPVHIPRGFTKAYIAGDVVEDLPATIRRSYETFLPDHDVLLVEGTGHAGVGAVIGLSNAAVARLLGTPAIIVSEGGIGRPIDEIVLNASLFAANGVPVAGAIVNKVDLDAQPSLPGVLERGLQRHGIRLLGVLPYRPILSNPTLGMIAEGLRATVVHPGPDLDRVIGDVAIGAMEPGHMLDRVSPGTLVIVPGDREDILLALTAAHLASPSGNGRDAAALRASTAAGIVLTGGYQAPGTVIEAIKAADLFCAIVPEDTYEVASEVHDLLVKTHPADTEKIALIKALVADFLDVDRILEVATPVPA
ncbi:MAG TPA: AAA family ATPase [Candidatus Limnocylindrales bacterium]|nr:AAA family ATPase [Candidatus Limnocylindrales bacterium]